MRVFLILILTTLGNHLHAQAMDLLEVTSGKMQSFPAFEGKELMVVVFYSHHCPYATKYEDRLKTLYSDYNEKVEFVLINSNNPKVWREEEELNMKAVARKKSYPFKYFADKDQLTVQMLNATKTPQAYILRKTNKEQFEVVYQGAIDDNPQSASAVHRHFLRDAIEDLLQNKTVEDTIPIGCRIKN